MTPIAKSRRPQAERAAEWVAVEVFGCVATRRALRTKFAKVDFFGCDVLGLAEHGVKFWIQVTAGQMGAVQVRRKKLTQYRWGDDDYILVMQLVERAQVDNPRRKEWFFRVWGLRRGGLWIEADPIPIKPEWFKARRET